MEIRAGTLLSSRYKLVEPIGQGGMGAVWRAEHVTLKAPCAVKLMDPSISHDPKARERFEREAQAAASLRSPHVVQITDFGVDGEVPYLVMELLEGESLRARLQRDRTLAFDATSKIVVETARALTKAHERGVIHRDIKPENIFLARIDHDEITKVLDFGIAKLATGAGLTNTGAVLGTPRYMSPEQVENRPIDVRVDLWSLALVAFECLVGRVPFDADSIPELVLQICARPLPVPSRIARVPNGFDAWFAKGAARDPGARFSSARHMADAFSAIASHTDATAPTVELTAQWSGGDKRAGFEIRVETSTGILHLKFWGLWDVALAERFRSSVLEAYTRFGGKKFVGLSDSTGFVPQRPEVQAMHKEVLKAAFTQGLTRVGVIVNSALSQMQIRRLFEEAGSPPNVRFTADPSEARAFIRG